MYIYSWIANQYPNNSTEQSRGIACLAWSKETKKLELSVQRHKDSFLQDCIQHNFFLWWVVWHLIVCTRCHHSTLICCIVTYFYVFLHVFNNPVANMVCETNGNSVIFWNIVGAQLGQNSGIVETKLRHSWGERQSWGTVGATLGHSWGKFNRQMFGA